MTNSLLQSLQHGLIVSCQAYPPNPFAGPHFMAAFAQAATMAGAVGLREVRYSHDTPHPAPPHFTHCMSTSTDGSVNGK